MSEITTEERLIVAKEYIKEAEAWFRDGPDDAIQINIGFAIAHVLIAQAELTAELLT